MTPDLGQAGQGLIQVFLQPGDVDAGPGQQRGRAAVVLLQEGSRCCGSMNCWSLLEGEAWASARACWNLVVNLSSRMPVSLPKAFWMFWR